MADHVETTCGTCGATDTHPKHVVHVGAATVFDSLVYHPHDVDKDGYVEYHFDCDHEWQDLADPSTVAAAKSGVHGDSLREQIQGAGN